LKMGGLGGGAYWKSKKLIYLARKRGSRGKYSVTKRLITQNLRG